MKITSITHQKRNKNRVSIFVDDEYFGSLDERTFLSSGFKSGDVLDASLWKSLCTESENQSAFNKGLTYISKLMRSEKQMKEYLAKKGYDIPAIDFAITKLIEYKYINDHAFAEMILSHQMHVKKTGLLAISQTFYKYGISNEIAQQVMTKYDVYAQQNNANELAEKLFKRYRTLDDAYKKKQKISQAMQRRGFSWDMISIAMKHSEDMH